MTNNITSEQLDSAQKYLKVAVQLIHQGKNEQVIRDHFTSHLRILFPAIPKWVTDHVLGGEAALKTHKESKESTGFVDNLIGLTAIEYESDLLIQSKFNEGHAQVRTYCASLINQGNDPSQIIGILSDTVRWYAYKIKIIKSAGKILEADDIELDEVAFVDSSSATEFEARRFIEFLIKYVQRIGSRPLDEVSIARDLGFESRFCERHLGPLSIVVAHAFSAKPDYAELIKKLWCNFVSYVSAKGKTNAFNSKEYTRELYLLTLGKLICANAIEEKALFSSDDELTEILSGAFFSNRGLENFVEYDYFGWLNNSEELLKQLLIVARGIQQDLRAYDFKQVPKEDIFGRLMTQLAERSQRILLGQECTPSWLARALVKKTFGELPPGMYPQFIDMSCGSGAIIFETIKQSMERIDAAEAKRNKAEKIELLIRSITGFDIDPLAVMLSKISWVLAAKSWLMPFGVHRITIPIYHADSLFAVTPLSKEESAGQEKITLLMANYTLALPAFLLSAEWQIVFDSLIDRAYAIAVRPDLEGFGRNQAAEIIDEIVPSAPEEINNANKEVLNVFLFDLIEKIHKLHREDKNGIWAFILRNNYRPALVAGQFNGLVANPPWLALSKIADNPYKTALGRMAESLGIKPKGASFLHLEMATIFLLRSVDRYLQNNAIIGCIVPEAVLNGNQHNLFREGAYENAEKPVHFSADMIWKVDERAFKNRAIVLFGRKKSASKAKVIPGEYILADGTAQQLEFHKVMHGSRTVWSDRSGTDTKNLFHPADFEQGADIMPRRLFFYEVTELKDSDMVSLKPIEQGSSALTFLVDDAKQSKDFKLFTPCTVPEKYICDVMLSKLLSPFHVAQPVKAFLPIRKDEKWSWVALTESELKGHADSAVAMRAFASISKEIGKLDSISSPTIDSIWKRINFRNKIGKQTFTDKGYLVFTGAGGSDICSAIVALEEMTHKKLIIDQTLYWAWVKIREEALYLCGMFNSEAANERIKAYQPRGQQGERHIHELVFGITPPFDPSKKSHSEVVRTTKALVSDYYAYLEAGKRNRNDSLKWLDASRKLSTRRSRLWDVIKSLPAYEPYKTACKRAYEL